MYTISINQQMLEKYPELADITGEFDDFFNHITSVSFSLKDLISINEDSCKADTDSCYARLYSLTGQTVLPISIVILCKDEERCIQRCIDSVISDAASEDEILVIDTGSSDRSLPLINQYSQVKLLQTGWENNFSKVRNLGLTAAKHKWVFFVDADEVVFKGSLQNLKAYLRLIDWLDIQPVVIAPTIRNSDNSIFQGVRRIVRKDSGIHYEGIIHEEFRINTKSLGTDVRYISFDNVILDHDGYSKDIMTAKDKIRSYVDSLKQMTELEPEHPRWLYFLCRDGKNILTAEEYENNLIRLIPLCEQNEEFYFFKTRALSDLIHFYLKSNRIEEAQKYLVLLKSVNPESSDIFYFEITLKIISLKLAYVEMLHYTIEYRQNRNVIDYGSMHSNYCHIDSLIAILFFEIGEYKKSFDLLRKLEYIGFSDYHTQFNALYAALNDFFQ